uniref:Uncharacterized protein n=1 Tax=Mycena chlorophos TaxID=658473 RepID=A0ABQ0LK58_MYCCL|nr:predicted protein [Mycena chlorophos]
MSFPSAKKMQLRRRSSWFLAEFKFFALRSQLQCNPVCVCITLKDSEIFDFHRPGVFATYHVSPDIWAPNIFSTPRGRRSASAPFRGHVLPRRSKVSSSQIQPGSTPVARDSERVVR